MPYIPIVSHTDVPLHHLTYKGFAITPRTFQIHGSGRWTLDLLIGRKSRIRAFSGPDTYPTEEAAIFGCCQFAHRIIDGQVARYPTHELP
ncbi:MAG TPA: hypothetical protein VNL18_08475 [Gemmatimonadales bacterium]|nr:hypothetical protein [Gemmatimonadales bacterium]